MTRTKFANDRPEVQSMADAIRLKCIDCSGWSIDEVDDCFDNDCPLYPHRMSGLASRASIAFLRDKRKNPS
jgi:hypothetical protein